MPDLTPDKRLRHTLDRANTDVVLVVDDVPDNLSMLHDALDESGYTVLVATNGEAALQRARQAVPDIILLDEALSGVDVPTTLELFDLFHKLAARDVTIMISTHDLGLARHRFHRCIAINRTICGDGLPADVLDPATLDAVFGSGSRYAEMS